MTNNPKLISFELSLSFYRYPDRGERFSLGESKKHGPMLNYYLDGEHYKTILDDQRMKWLCDVLEKHIAGENQRHYTNFCVDDGAYWRLEAKTDTETYSCSGSNYYPKKLQLLFALIHFRFGFPCAEIYQEFKTMDQVDPECIRVRIADEELPLNTFPIPDGVPEPTDPAFKTAKAVALDWAPDIDMYTEYENAYVFSSTTYFGLIGPSPLIVMKDTGESYLMHADYPDIGKEVGPMTLFNGEVLDPGEEDEYEE